MKKPSPIVEAIGLRKVFRDFWGREKAIAVDGIDLSIGTGEIFGLLGPNGSGKSTTVKMAVGLLRADAGTIRVFGVPPDNVPIKHRIGYLPEETCFYDYVTAFETLDYLGALFELSSRERRRRASELLELVGLGHAGNRRIGEFSKGMRRRVGLAQALINDPDLVILDEPTADLDPVGCGEIKTLIKLLADRGKTVVICSHLLADIEDICGRIAIMYNGRICVTGTLAQLLEDTTKVRLTIDDTGQDPDIPERIRRALGNVFANVTCEVSHPQMSLESFFISAVTAAATESPARTGARTGGAVPEHLMNEAEAGARDADILRGLTRPSPPIETTAQPSLPPAPDTAQLASLTGSSEPSKLQGD